MDLLDYKNKLDYAENILIRLERYSIDFPTNIETPIWFDEETTSGEWEQQDLQEFLNLERKLEAPICSGDIRYFTELKYTTLDGKNFPLKWLKYLELEHCIYETPEIDQYKSDSRCTYPAFTITELHKKLLEWYKVVGKSYNLQQIPLPTYTPITVRNLQTVVEDMITHCQQGKMLIDNELIAPKIQPAIPVAIDPLKQYLEDVQTGKIEPFDTPPPPENNVWSELDIDILLALKGTFCTQPQLFNELNPNGDIEGRSREAIRDAISKKSLLRTSGIVKNKPGSGYYRIDATSTLN